MTSLSFILTSAVVSLAIAALTVTVITVKHLVDWFAQRIGKIRERPSRLAFTIKEEIENGRCAVIQGIFDSDEVRVIEARRIEGDRVDRRVIEAHAGQPVAIWS